MSHVVVIDDDDDCNGYTQLSIDDWELSAAIQASFDNVGAAACVTESVARPHQFATATARIEHDCVSPLRKQRIESRTSVKAENADFPASAATTPSPQPPPLPLGAIARIEPEIKHEIKPEGESYWARWGGGDGGSGGV